MSNRAEYTEWTCFHCSGVATTIREGSAVCRLHAAQPREAGQKWRLLETIRTVIATVFQETHLDHVGKPRKIISGQTFVMRLWRNGFED